MKDITNYKSKPECECQELHIYLNNSRDKSVSGFAEVDTNIPKYIRKFQKLRGAEMTRCERHTDGSIVYAAFKVDAACVSFRNKTESKRKVSQAQIDKMLAAKSEKQVK